MKRKGLGKGLDALFSGGNIIPEKNKSKSVEIQNSDKDVKLPQGGLTDKKEEIKNFEIEVDLNKIEPNKNQPRKNFDDEKILELSESIKEIGIVQPIVVKQVGEFYQIIAGERRWRAARVAGLKKVPIIVKDFDEVKTLEASLIENIQRENLNPIEEAFTYKKFHDEFGFNQETIAQKVGKSRTAVANSIRLLNLDSRVQQLVKENKLSNGHARALLPITDNDAQFEVAEKIIDDGFSVRMTEEFVRKYIEAMQNKNEENSEKTQKAIEPNFAEYRKIEKSLKDILGTKVTIKNGKNKGKIEIEYYSEDELDRLICMLNSVKE